MFLNNVILCCICWYIFEMQKSWGSYSMLQCS